MSFERPTLTEIVDRVQTDFVTRLSLAGAVLRRSVIYVLSRVIAGAAHMLHGHLDYLARQLFPDLSDEAYLIRQAGLFGIAKTAATYATGQIEINGTEGEIVPAGTVWVRDDGAEYTTDVDAEIGPAGVIADITASEAGEDGTLTDGLELTIESPIADVDSTAVVQAGVDGTDEETTDALRVRLLEHLAEPAHGGNEADYIAWAKTVAGVTRVWVEPLLLGPGTVVVYFARDDDASPIPSAGEVAEVQAVFDEEAPAHAEVTAIAPTAFPVDLVISITPDNADTRAAVEAEVEDLLQRVSEPAGTVLLSAIRTAIGTSAGITDYVLSDPLADVVAGAGQLPVMGTITWV